MKGNVNTRMLPQSVEAEKQVLAALLCERDSIHKVRKLLEPGSFYDNRNGIVYQAISNLSDKNKPIDSVCVVEQLNKQGDLDRAGGMEYIQEITFDFVTSIGLEEHAQIVHQKSLQRMLIEMCERAKGSAYDGTIDIQDVVIELSRNLDKISNVGYSEGYSSLQSVIEELDVRVLDNAEGKLIESIPTGFKHIDDYTMGGFHYSELNVIAAESSQGKTSFALAILQHMADNTKCVIYSTEMRKAEISAKLISMNTEDLSAAEIAFKGLDRYHMQKYHEGRRKVIDKQITFDDNNEINHIMSSMQMHVRHGVKVFFIDYLQNLTRPGVKDLAMHFETVCSDLKNFARKNNVCVILLSQFNRDKDNKNPSMDRLKGSSGIGAACDYMISILRPEAMVGSSIKKYPLKEFENVSIHGTALIMCNKGRFTGFFPPFICGFDGRRTLFYELEDNQLPIEHNVTASSREIEI